MRADVLPETHPILLRHKVIAKIPLEKKIRFALVGCGRISINHIEAILNYSDDSEITAICDVDKVISEKVGARLNVRHYSSYEEMLEAGGFDVVVLMTPSGIHAKQAILAAKFGFHVVTEKPMATRWIDGVEMVKACDNSGVRLFVVKQNRNNATLQLLKKAIDSNRFGKIYMVVANVFWSRPQEYYDSAKWRGTWEFDGGAFMNQASHYVDLLDWLIGPVESVQSYTSTLARNIEVEDTGVMAIKWRSGAIGSMNVTMLTYPKNFEGSITILGEKGSVRVGGVAVNKVEHWDFFDSNEEDELIKLASYETTSVYGHGHTLYYKNIIEVLRGESEPQTDGREGLRSLELLVATYLASRDGRKISLPLNN
jgi:UDP-N-acetyl-2-amino-2-deoxyglucuronate dehydrogenase